MSETLLTRRGFVGAMSALGCLRAAGPDHRNFEMEVEARAGQGIPSGIRFHKDLEIRVGNAAREKTGSLVGLRNVYKRLFLTASGSKLRRWSTGEIFRFVWTACW